MSTAQFLITGSEKVLAHYKFLLDTAKSVEERALFAKRIQQEHHNLNRLLAEFDQPARAA